MKKLFIVQYSTDDYNDEAAVYVAAENMESAIRAWGRFHSKPDKILVVEAKPDNLIIDGEP